MRLLYHILFLRFEFLDMVQTEGLRYLYSFFMIFDHLYDAFTSLPLFQEILSTCTTLISFPLRHKSRVPSLRGISHALRLSQIRKSLLLRTSLAASASLNIFYLLINNLITQNYRLNVPSSLHHLTHHCPFPIAIRLHTLQYQPLGIASLCLLVISVEGAGAGVRGDFDGLN